MKKLFLVAAAALMLMGCSAPKIMYQESSGRNIEPTQNAVIVPMVADLEMVTTEQIEYVETFEVEVTQEVVGSIDAYKRVALVNATKKYKADTMVAALINVSTRSDGEALIITVTGFPAKYKNWRGMKQEDAWLLDSHNNQLQSTQIVR